MGHARFVPATDKALRAQGFFTRCAADFELSAPARGKSRAFKVIFKRPRNRIAVIPMPHSKIFKSESHLRAH
jgi:hypothetical protein